MVFLLTHCGARLLGVKLLARKGKDLPRTARTKTDKINEECRLKVRMVSAVGGSSCSSAPGIVAEIPQGVRSTHEELERKARFFAGGTPAKKAP
jgi:hypothetical protein